MKPGQNVCSKELGDIMKDQDSFIYLTSPSKSSSARERRALRREANTDTTIISVDSDTSISPHADESVATSENNSAFEQGSEKAATKNGSSSKKIHKDNAAKANDNAASTKKRSAAAVALSSGAVSKKRPADKNNGAASKKHPAENAKSKAAGSEKRSAEADKNNSTSSKKLPAEAAKTISVSSKKSQAGAAARKPPASKKRSTRAAAADEEEKEEEDPYPRTCRRSSEEPDVTIIVGGYKFLEYSQVLRSWSAYFDAALQDQSSFEFKDGNPKDWEWLMKITQPCPDEFINESNIIVALEWFETLHSDIGLEQCDSVYMNSTMDRLSRFLAKCMPRDKLFEALEFALIHNLPKSKEKAYDNLRRLLKDAPHVLTSEDLEKITDLLKKYQSFVDDIGNDIKKVLLPSTSDKPLKQLLEKDVLPMLLEAGLDHQKKLFRVTEKIHCANGTRTLRQALKRDEVCGEWFPESWGEGSPVHADMSDLSDNEAAGSDDDADESVKAKSQDKKAPSSRQQVR